MENTDHKDLTTKEVKRRNTYKLSTTLPYNGNARQTFIQTKAYKYKHGLQHCSFWTWILIVN